MDWAYKGMLTAVVVAAVLMAAPLFGRRVAGLLAGLPVITIPALLWLSADRGVAFAAESAIGSVAASGAAAVFALTYQRLGQRLGPALSLVGSLVLAGALAAMLAMANLGAAGALTVALAACALVLRALPAVDPATRPPRPLRGELWIVAGIAGLVSAVLAAGAAQFGPFWSGLLASLPVISACVLVHLHLTADGASIARFLRGYVVGLGCKALFGIGFAVLVIHWPAPLAALLALAAALTVGRLAWLRPRPVAPRSTPA